MPEALHFAPPVNLSSDAGLRTKVPQSRVDIVFCASANYFQHTATAVVSVAEGTRHPDVRVHVMTCDRNPAAEARLVATVKRYGHLTLEIHHVEDARLDRMFFDRHLTKETYLRFLVTQYLPSEIERALYLDSDLVVLGDVAELLRVDLNGRAIGAVPELECWGGGPNARLAKIGIKAGRAYFNAGVLLIDLVIWRKASIPEQLFTYAAGRGSHLEYHDQDALNVVLQDDVTFIDRRWNVQVFWYSEWVRRDFPSDRAASKEALRNPAIIHFSTAHKPWTYRAKTRKKALYFRFLDGTAWRGERPAGLTPLQKLEYDVSRALLRAGIDLYVGRAIVGHARQRLARAAACLRPSLGARASDSGRA